ncbi:unnamed protein product, partial [Ectocarpus sp. 8 AP-2014]
KLTIWTVRLHVVTVTVAILAFLFSALTGDSEIDHRILAAQSANELVIDAGVVGDALEQTAPDVNCHVGHSCDSVIVPISDMASERFGSSSESPTDPHFKPHEVRYLLFHPPRRLSRV